jgi:alkylation response protein AidB-like acyl-CoA dehydrogenase
VTGIESHGQHSIWSSDVEEFRRQSRKWLAANLDRRSPAGAFQGVRKHDPKSADDIIVERDLQRRLYDAGLAGISFPREYGGQGLTVEHERAFNLEASLYRTPDFGISTGTTFTVCAQTMLAHASSDFLRRHIPMILRGDELWAQFFSEPEAGSDLAGIRTRATRDGDRWILNGAKIWTSGAHVADYGMCLARTDWDVPKHQGLTWFAVSTSAPGVRVNPIRQLNGEAEFCEEFFDDVELSDKDIIGELNDGWTVARTMLVFERGGGLVRVEPVTSPQLAPDLVALAHRMRREHDPVVRQLVARAHINDYAQEQLELHLGSLMKATSKPNAGIMAYRKLAAGTMLPIRTLIAMQIGGASTIAWDPNGEGDSESINYLAGRRLSIAGGTNEMQRNGIGERVLGLPREPSFDTTKPFREVLQNAAQWSQRK